MKKLKSEFYENFHESMEIVNAGIFASGLLKEVEKYFSIDSTICPRTSTTIRLVSIISEYIDNGNIYKKCIFSYFSEPKLKVLRAIYKLSNDSIVSLFKFCSLEEKQDLIEEIGENYTQYYRSYQYSLSRINDILNGCVKFDSLFDEFPNYTKEEILSCLELLNVYEKYLIFKKYGENLDGDGMYLMPEENKKVRVSIFKKMRRYLKKLRNGYKILGLLDVYPNLTLNEIKEYIDLLTEKQKNYFYEIFGEKLDRKRIVSKNDDLINSAYKKPLDKVIYYTGRKLKPFFAIFESFKNDGESLEDFNSRVKDAVSTLESRALTVTKHIYGENYDNLVAPSDVTKIEMRYFTSDVVPLIKNRLGSKEVKKDKRKKLKGFYERFSLVNILFFDKDVYLSEILYSVSLLNEIEKELLNRMFGKNLDEINELDYKEMIQVNKIINRIRKKVYKKISKDIGVSLSKLKNLSRLYNNVAVRKMFSGLDFEVIVSVIAYLYFDMGVGEIYKVLGINPLIHLESVKEILEEKEIKKKTLNIWGV